MRRSARVLSLVVPALTAALASACAGHGITLGPAGHPTDPALLLSCARSVATERGLGEAPFPGKRRRDIAHGLGVKAVKEQHRCAGQKQPDLKAANRLAVDELDHVDRWPSR